ncbi:MAG: hypothetical protein IKC93_07930 [Candidatus Methanomethylophilaceae archaeon]|nr:hypothetical protein [Candidatus Methanomethylophilaceae archaeon]
MNDVILVTCGSSAGSILSNAGESFDIPLVYSESGSDMSDVIKGYRVVAVFALLGGISGTADAESILQCARRLGSRTVSILGLPMEFESDRRERALESLDSISELSDRMFMMDEGMLLKLYPDIKVRRLFPMVAHTMTFTIRTLMDMVRGPFFSTFYEKAYTFAYVVDMDPVGAVERAMDSSMFETDPELAKTIVAVSSTFGQAEVDAANSIIARMTGIVPDIVKRRDSEDARILVFLSVLLP